MPYIGPGPSTAAAGATSVSSGHLAVSSGQIAILSGNIAISGSVSVLAGSISVSSGLVAVTSGNIAISGSVTVLSGIVTIPQLPAAAALADNLANPTTSQVGANALRWDAANSQWVRQRSHNARNLISLASYNLGAGAANAAAAQTATTERQVFAVLYCSVAGTGNLTFRILGRASSTGAYCVMAYLTVTGTGIWALAYGPGCTGNGTSGLTQIGGFVAGILPRDWYVDVVHSAASAWTYQVDVDSI